MAGFWDWYSNAVAQGDGLGAQPQPSPYAPQAVPQPPGRPDAGLYPPRPVPAPPGRPAGIMPPPDPVIMPSGLPYDPPVYSPQNVPQPPARPDAGLYPPRMVPTPPGRPAGLTPPVRTSLYGDPSVAMPSGLPYDPPTDPTQPMRPVPLPPRRPANLIVQTPAARAPQAPQARPADMPAPGAVPTSLPAGGPPMAPQAPVGQETEWVQDIDPITRQTYWTQRVVTRPSTASSPAGTGSGLEAFLGRLTSQNGAPASVGANGPQIPNPTGLAAALGAQPSMQAQNSTGPTAFLDQLFGFRG